ncbi:MAG: STT3 domain-containing protein [Candidatus Diapherotrites archaeon]
MDLSLGSIKSKIMENKKTVFILFLLFLLAFGIRAYLIRFELFFEFDSYWHARVVSYVIQTGSVPARDPLAYYQMGGSVISWRMFPIWWYSSALIYNIFTLWGPYNEATWIFFVKLIPAFWGAMTAIAMYFLFKELYNDRKAGYLGAFFAAVTPAFVYRTMAGFFEGASMTFFPMVLGFYFAVRMIKRLDDRRSAIINSVLAGIFLSLSLWAGGGWYLIAMYVIVGCLILIPVLMFVRGVKTKKIIDLFVLIIIIIGIFSALNLVKGWGFWTDGFTGYIQFYTLKERPASDIFTQTVGEQSPGWPSFGTKYNALFIFPILLLVIAPVWLWKKKNDFALLLIFLWVVGTWYMAVNRLQMTYAFGLGVAAAAAVVTYSLYIFSAGRPSIEKKVIGLFIGFMMLLGVASAVFFMTQNPPNIEYDNSWKDALNWVKNNTEKDAKFFNWWNEGHWITFVGQRMVTTDNRNNDLNANFAFGKFSTSESEDEALNIIKKYGSDYIIAGSSDTLESLGSMAFYANEAKLDYSNPKINKYFVNRVPCSKETNKITNEVSYTCGQNQIPESVFLQLPYVYITTPNQLYSESMPLFMYRTENNSDIYVLNAAANKTILARIWFDDPSIKNIKEVYSASGSNTTVKVFKVG